MKKITGLGQLLKKGHAKHRIFMITVALIFIIFLLFLIAKFIGLHNQSVGSSDVSTLPSINEAQGGQTSPAYQRALETSNAQKATVAKKTGTSAIATIINDSKSTPQPIGACVQCCSNCTTPSVDSTVASLLSAGEISQATADLLNQLASEHLSPEEYANQLAELVRQGKLTPEQARQLLAAYKTHYQEGIEKNGAQDLDPMIKSGALAVDTASTLLDAQKQDLNPGQYGNNLQALINTGSLSPDQADDLLKKYKVQRDKRLAAETTGQVNAMLDTGQIDPDVANALKTLQNSNVPIEEYAAFLDRLVKEGKLSPEEAKRLLAQYRKLHGADSSNDAAVDAYTTMTELTQKDGDALRALQANNASVDEFATKLQSLVRNNNMSTQTARRLLTQYQAEYNAKQKVLKLLQTLNVQGRLSTSALGTLQAAVMNAASLAEFSMMLQKFAHSSEVDVASMQDLSNSYNEAITSATQKDELVRYFESKSKLPEDAAGTLSDLQNNNASVSTYADALQKLVDAGIISPETAKALLDAYRAKLVAAQENTGGFTVARIDTNIPGSISPAVANTGNPTLDRVTQAGYAQQQAQAQQKDYSGAQAFAAQTQQQAMQQRQQAIQVMTQAMLAKASLIVQNNMTPAAQMPVLSAPTEESAASAAIASAASGVGLSGEETKPLIKAGSILYGVLDTEVNSDYADSPVMVTVVSGEFKGAKLLGSIKTANNGQRVMLALNLMTMDAWATGKNVSAFVIDPDTARSAVATDVNNHYLLRYGSLFAASFISGMGEAVSESGTEVTSDSGVVTSSTADLNTSEKLLVALGSVGDAASGEVNKLVNTPPTVKVRAGIGVGILFMSDVAETQAAPAPPVPQQPTAKTPAQQVNTQGGATNGR